MHICSHLDDVSFSKTIPDHDQQHGSLRLAVSVLNWPACSPQMKNILRYCDEIMYIERMHYFQYYHKNSQTLSCYTK